MTREIKFRAWDKKEKKWLFGYEFPMLGGFSMVGEVMMMGDYANLLSDYFPDRLDDIVIMQYTGLKDKNGKEIYDGDIIHLQGVARYEVKFIRGGFAVDFKDGHRYLGQFADPEVIGNVYQNPDLLK